MGGSAVFGLIAGRNCFASACRRSMQQQRPVRLSVPLLTSRCAARLSMSSTRRVLGTMVHVYVLEYTYVYSGFTMVLEYHTKYGTSGNCNTVQRLAKGKLDSSYES